VCYFSEALTGIVNLKNLQKHHKRLGGGRMECWNVLTQHLVKMLESRRWNLDDMCR